MQNTFKLQFNMDNAAFDPECRYPEIARILTNTATRILNGDEEGTTKDINGNTIGEFSADWSGDEDQNEDEEEEPEPFPDIRLVKELGCLIMKIGNKFYDAPVSEYGPPETEENGELCWSDLTAPDAEAMAIINRYFGTKLDHEKDFAGR